MPVVGYKNRFSWLNSVGAAVTEEMQRLLDKTGNVSGFIAHQGIFEIANEIIQHIASEIGVPFSWEHALRVNKQGDRDV